MFGGDDGFDPATDVEVAYDAHPSGVHVGDEVIEDLVDGTFVKNAVVSEAPEVEFEALEFHAGGGGGVGNADGREIGGAAFEEMEFGCVGLYAADGAEGGELGAVHVDFVFPIGVGVRECFQQLGFGHAQM